MTRKTTEELRNELQQVVNKHNESQEIVNQMKNRFTEINAIIKDREEAEKEAKKESVSEDSTST